MSNLVQSFYFDDVNVRIHEENQETWFCAKDVCAVLDISWKGSSDNLAKIPNEWKGYRCFRTPGGNQELAVINIKAVYKLAFRSNKPEADKFTEWACEVIDQVQKKGTYSLSSHPREWPLVTEDARAYHDLAVLLGNSQSVAKAETVQFIGREHNKDVKHLLKNNVADVQRPLLTATQLGARIGKSAQTMNLILQGEGFQRKENKSWIPTEKAVGHYEALDVGKSRSNGTPVRQIKWYDSVLESLQSA